MLLLKVNKLFLFNPLEFLFGERIWDKMFRVCLFKEEHIKVFLCVTCARYYNHRTSCFCKLIAKDHYLLGYIYIYIILFYFILFLSQNSKIVEVNMTMDFYG